MQIINFAHPLTRDQLAGIQALANIKIAGVIEVGSQIDLNKAIEPQIEAMLDQINLTPQEWQTKPILINLPSLNFSTAALLAQLHGRVGYFPSILRLKPDTGGLAPRFEVKFKSAGYARAGREV